MVVRASGLTKEGLQVILQGVTLTVRTISLAPGIVSSTTRLPFADALSEDVIEKAFDDEDASFADDEDVVYTPAITLWAFLSPVLFKDELRSCVAAVARVVVGALNCGFRISDCGLEGKRRNAQTSKSEKRTGGRFGVENGVERKPADHLVMRSGDDHRPKEVGHLALSRG